MKTPTELIDYLDHVYSSLTTDYDVVYNNTRQLLAAQELPRSVRADLEWSLTRLHTDLTMLMTSIKNQQKYLKEADASTTIQDTIRGNDLSE